MRIVHLVETLEVGGLERFVVDLAREQKRAGHAPYAYCMFRAGALGEDLRQAGIPVHELNKAPGFSPRILLRLAAQLRRDSPAVLHTHNPGVHPYGALAARLAGVRAVINTRHGVMTSMCVTQSERVFRAVIPLTSKVVFVSDDSRRVLVEERGLPARKAVVIRNGISLAPFEQPAAPGSSRPHIRFGSIARMVPVKAQNILIDAFALVSRCLPEARLHIAGGGPLLGELGSQVARLGLESRVTLEGTTREVSRLLQSFDVFVLSSLSEGLPITILEAMAAGLPIVSTRVGGIAEVAPEGSVAWYCPPGSAAMLAEAMLKAAASPKLECMGRTAWERARANYGIGRAHQEYSALYESLLT